MYLMKTNQFRFLIQHLCQHKTMPRVEAKYWRALNQTMWNQQVMQNKLKVGRGKLVLYLKEEVMVLEDLVNQMTLISNKTQRSLPKDLFTNKAEIESINYHNLPAIIQDFCEGH